MNDAQEKAKKEYLEVLGYHGEIEFIYNGHFYHIEPTEEGDGEIYGIWRYDDKTGCGGKMIARCTPPETILEEKIFDGKTILEIEGEMTDCILR